MEKLKIRRAAESDMDVINKLLYQVLKVHSDARPDLFKAGTKKYKAGKKYGKWGNGCPQKDPPDRKRSVFVQ